MNSTAIEIYKIGLYPEHTNKGYGSKYLNMMLEILFNESNRDIVYLNTRDTNHAGVINFYKVNGVDVFHTETLNSDIVRKPMLEQAQDPTQTPS